MTQSNFTHKNNRSEVMIQSAKLKGILSNCNHTGHTDAVPKVDA